MENPVENIRKTVNDYNRLIEIIENNKNSGNICILSKKEISKRYGLSYTGTLKKLNFLLKYGLINQVGRGFERTEKDVLHHTPIGLLPRIFLLVLEQPEVYSSFKQQSELLSVPIEDIKSAWDFTLFFLDQSILQNRN